MKLTLKGIASTKRLKASNSIPRSTSTSSLSLLAQYDKEEDNNNLPDGRITEFNNGFEEIKLEEPVSFPGNPTEYHYMFEIDKTSQGWQHVLAVTAFDRGRTRQ